MWFSKDGTRLAFARFNDTVTRVMSIPYYGVPGNLDFQYTRAVNIKYPKVRVPLINKHNFRNCEISVKLLSHSR